MLPTPSDCYNAPDTCGSIPPFQPFMFISNVRKNTQCLEVLLLQRASDACLFPHFERAILKIWKRRHYVMNKGKMKHWNWRITFLPLSRPLLCSEYHTVVVTEATAPVIFSPAAEWTMGRTVTETLSELRWPAVSVTISWKIYPPSWMWDSFSVPGCGTWVKTHSKKTTLAQWIHPYPSRNKEVIMQIKYFSVV